MGNHKKKQVTEAWIRNQQRKNYNEITDSCVKNVRLIISNLDGLIMINNEGMKFDLHTYNADDEFELHNLKDSLEKACDQWEKWVKFRGELAVLSDEETLAIPNRKANDIKDSKSPAWNNDL